MKSGELEKRSERRKEAQESLDKAVESGNQEDITKFNKRVIRVTQKHNDDCKKLLKLMGLPVIEAPCEAEAQCAQLCKDGKVHAVATEDMDALTFATPRLIRHLSSGSNEKTQEYNLEKVLSGLGLSNQDEFIDLCILMGCDYCDSIKGIGGKKGLDLIKKHKTIENIIEHLPSKETVPKDWQLDAVRKLFKEPLVTKSELISEEDLKIKDIDEEGIVQFLCAENGFDEKRVRNAIERCKAAKPKSAQTRIDSFFQIKPSEGVKRSPAVAAKAYGKQNTKKSSGNNKRFRK
jgi:flap endonuclease-1